MDAVKFEVPPELFVTTESSSFAGQLALGTLEAGPDTYTFSQPVDWNVTVTNTGDALLVMGSARGTATVACARCLDDFQVDLNGEVEGYFLLSEDGPAPEDMDDDEFEVLGADKSSIWSRSSSPLFWWRLRSCPCAERTAPVCARSAAPTSTRGRAHAPLSPTTACRACPTVASAPSPR